MRAYIFNADIYCEHCAGQIMADLREEHADEADSDTFPQGPYSDGGGEADCPQHCGNCRAFLENPLTDDGRDYVAERLAAGTGNRDVLETWSRFYGIARLDTFTRAYIEAALWSSVGDDDESLDHDYDASDIAPVCLIEMAADCADFQRDNDGLLAEITLERAGHDFWLTRNRHGAGFWDRGLGEVGTRLTEAAHVYGNCDLYVGDDGKIYCA